MAWGGGEENIAVGGFPLLSQSRDRLDLFMPLYGFKSEPFQIPGLLELALYEEQSIGDLFHPESRFCRTLALTLPDTLLRQRGDLSRLSTLPESLKAAEDPQRELGEFLLRSYSQELDDFEALITSLRLYKSDQFRRGPVWVLVECPSSGEVVQIELEFKNLHARFRSGLDQGAGRGAGYICDPHDRSAFAIFDQQWRAIVPLLQKFPRFQVALGYYNESYTDKAEAYQLIDLVVVLEALLLKQEEGLNYQLAVRCANLLGVDADQRRERFKEIKDYYDVRCKLIHGDVLKDKHLQRLSTIPRLRELVRLTLLSTASLASTIQTESEYFRILDEMSLDDRLRSETQKHASRLVHI